MTPSVVTPMPFRIVAPSILIRAPRFARGEIEGADRVDVDRVKSIALDRAAERMVQRELVARDADPFARVHRAVGVDQRHEAVVLHEVLRIAGIHRDDEVARRVEGTALREVEAAIDLDVVRHGLRRAGLVGRAEWRADAIRLRSRGLLGRRLCERDARRQ